MSVPKIAQLAPLLFFIVAEASLKRRCEKLDEFEAALHRVVEAAWAFPRLLLNTDDQDTGIKAERASIENRDLFGEWFGRDRVSEFFEEGEDNPFEAYLKALTATLDDITDCAVGPTWTEYRVCRSEAIDLAEDDEEVAEWLLNGEVPIHRMPRGLKTGEERIAWMRQNKISVRKVPEEEEFSSTSIMDLLS